MTQPAVTTRPTRVATLIRVCHLKTGDKFRAVNGDGELFSVLAAVHDSLVISVDQQKVPAKHYSFSFFDYVELVSSTDVGIYGVFIDTFGEEPQLVSCHVEKSSAYKAIFKLRNEYWYHSRRHSIGNFHKTLNIDAGYFKPHWFIKPLTLNTGED
jgi:hypothetical protein